MASIRKDRCCRAVCMLAVAACFVVLTSDEAIASVCGVSAADGAWLSTTVTRWEAVRRNELKQPGSHLPWMVLFDEGCVFNINPNPKFFVEGKAARIDLLARGDAASYALSHSGTVRLPDGAEAPAQLLSFAGNYDEGRDSFLAAALPTVWRKAEHLRNEPNLDLLVRSVYIHELTHTYHRKFFSRLSEIEKGLKDVQNFDDDIVQKTFEKDEGFRTAYLNEIELAKTAVVEPDRKKRRRLAGRLGAAMRERRKKYYTGANAGFAEIEDIFLMMEGVANWAAYRSAVADGLAPADALKLIRRNGKWWSQEEGILIFMLIDSLSDNWQAAAFAPEPVTVVDLLSRAAR